MPIHYVGEGDDDTRVSFAVQRALKIGHLRTGDLVVATAGRSQQTGGTDMIQVLRV